MIPIITWLWVQRPPRLTNTYTTQNLQSIPVLSSAELNSIRGTSGYLTHSETFHIFTMICRNLPLLHLLKSQSKPQQSSRPYPWTFFTPYSTKLNKVITQVQKQNQSNDTEVIQKHKPSSAKGTARSDCRSILTKQKETMKCYKPTLILRAVRNQAATARRRTKQRA